jgi:anti-anti-sigma regulatory factor
MNLSISQVQGRVQVTVLSIHGDLDGSTYTSLIAKVKELYQAGTRHLLLDMSLVAYMSSSGLVALHSAALLMSGEQPPDPEDGWGSIHAAVEGEAGLQKNVKLLNPQPRVDRTLEVSGMKEYFEIFTDLNAAVASF